MVKPSEDQVVQMLEEERWLRREFSLKRLESYQNVYRGSGSDDYREADLVGIDYDNNVYAFEVKTKGLDIGSAFDQVSAYSQGANFVYCVLEEKSVSEESKKTLKKTGIGLIVYQLEKGSPTEIKRIIESIDHKGSFVERTRNSMTEEVATPKCYVFPSADPQWLPKKWRENDLASGKKPVKWYYDAKLLPPTGSIIIFSSKGYFVGQGTVIESRNTAADDRKEGYKWSRLLVFWGKSFLKYPRKVPIAEVKDSIHAIRNKDLRMANYQIKYKPISSLEAQKIVSKALNVLSSNKKPDNS
nr:hypothetical protein [Candidatus Njordarchaeota archaeon]